MLTTATMPRTLVSAAVMTGLAFALLSADAHASRGLYQCSGSLQLPRSAGRVAAASSAVVCLVNIERATRGIDPLTRDTDLGQAARGHARDMALRQYFGHVSANGRRLGDRLKAAGYGDPGDGWRAGEDLGWGAGRHATPNAIVDGWMNSDAHRRILLSPAYKEIGVGVAVGAPKPTRSGELGATYAMDVGTIRTGAS